MSLDPQAKAMLDALSEMALPPLDTVTPAEMREMMQMPPPEQMDPVASVADHAVPVAGDTISVRVYTPEGDGPFGALVYFHGGGFVLGKVADYDAFCRTVAHSAGLVVASVEYRLAPEHKFPAAPDDCLAATRWVVDHAGDLNIDPARVAVGGDSAGGCLAAVVAQQVRAADGPAIAHQVLIYPVTDFNLDTASYRDNAEGYFLTRDMMRWFWGHYLRAESDGADLKASPLRAGDLGGLPPATVITAGYDPLRDEGDAYASALEAAGVAVEHRCYDGMFHGFVGFGLGLDKAAEATTWLCDILRSAVGPQH